MFEMERVKQSHNAGKEYRLLMSLDSPRIIRPVGIDGDQIILPHYKEGSADGISGYCNEKEAWRFLHDVADGLAYLHSKGIIHMDIKPTNILIDKAGYVICDFDMGDDEDSHSFSPPEWDKTRSRLNEKSDIWALGASVFNLIMGVKVFGGYGGKAQKKDTPVPSLRTDRYSSKLSELITRCLDWDPHQRPSAVEIAEIASEQLKRQWPKRERKGISDQASETPDEFWPEEMEQAKTR